MAIIKYIKTKKQMYMPDKDESGSPISKKTDMYVVRKFKSDPITVEDLVNEDVWGTTFTKADMLNFFKNMARQITNHVLTGKNVKFFDVGTFSPRIRAKAVSSLDDVDIDTIKDVRVGYLPSKEIRKGLKQAKFKFLDLNKIKHV